MPKRLWINLAYKWTGVLCVSTAYIWSTLLLIDQTKLELATARRALSNTHNPTATAQREAWSSSLLTSLKDSKGAQATFHIFLLSDQFKWKINSCTSLENENREPSFSSEMIDLINNQCDEIICLGASSEEMVGNLASKTAKKREEERAACRAKTIAKWVQGVLTRDKPVRKINIGFWENKSGQIDTSDQRRAIIVLVSNKQEGANIDELLRTALSTAASSQPIFSSVLTQYSLTKGGRFTWLD